MQYYYCVYYVLTNKKKWKLELGVLCEFFCISNPEKTQVSNKLIDQLVVSIYSFVTSDNIFLLLISQVLKLPSPSKSEAAVALAVKESFDASTTSIL